MTITRVLRAYRVLMALAWLWAWVPTVLSSIPAPPQSGKPWER